MRGKGKFEGLEGTKAEMRNFQSRSPPACLEGLLIICEALAAAFHDVRDRQNAGSCELYYRWNSVTCMGKRYLLPKTIPPIAMVKFATATVLRLPKESKSSRPPETTVPVLKLH